MLTQGIYGIKTLSLYNGLLQTVKKKVRNPDIDLVRRAFQAANKGHENQKRLSGEPYIIHPLNVARILAEHGLDSATIAAGLLHDLVEDTEYTHDDIIREFGEEINELVRSVTKISIVKKESTAKDSEYSRLKEMEAAENIRLMLLATARDVRVILVKLADKLHNMRTLQFQKPHKIQRIAIEVMNIYAPLAGRLGMFRIKSELEDLAFAQLHPNEYSELLHDLNESRVQIEDYVQKIRRIVIQRLQEIKINATVMGRAKHMYSIWYKMQSQHKSLNEIYDLRGVRIIVDEIRDCYGALGIVHTLWPPIQGRFKDYIATPKVNGYQSLHTSVIGPDGRPLEVQIRTKEMEEMADHGIAAHWIYKSGGTANGGGRTKWLNSLSKIIEANKDTSDTSSFLEEISHELSPEEVYVFTPRGDILDLPLGATVLDFAFRVHTDVGLHCRGAKVNDRIVPLRTELKSGDRVEIITDKSAQPSPNWLRYLKSQRARQKLRAYLSRKDKDQEDTSASKDNDMPFKRKFNFLRSKKTSEKSAQESVETSLPNKEFRPSPQEEELLIRRGKSVNPKEAVVEVAGSRNIPVRYAGCCGPVPGDEIVGFITRGRGVTIHKKDCSTLPRDGEAKGRLIPVRWEGLTEKYPVLLSIKANDRQGLYLDLVGNISKTFTNILKAEADIPQNGEKIMFARFLLEVEHADHLTELIDGLRGIDGVEYVERVQDQQTDDPSNSKKKTTKKRSRKKTAVTTETSNGKKRKSGH